MLEIVGTIDVPFVLAWIVVPAVLVWFVWWIAKRARLGWGFWLLWVLASTVGWYSGFYVGIFGTLAVEAILPNYGGAVLWAGLGAGVGILQWFVLRWRVSRSGWWVLASILGLAVAAVLGTAVALARGYSIMPWSPAVVAGVGGAMAGIMQWFVLRRQVSRAGWWVLASTVGWAVSMEATGFLSPNMAMAVVGLGAVTGLALVWLLRQPVPEA